MGHGTFAKRGEIVSALEARNEPPAAMPACKRDKFAGEPAVVVRVQTHLCQRIAGMGIEACGDEQQVGCERVDSGQQIARPGGPKLAATTSRRKRRIGDVARTAAFVPCARAGIERALVRTGEEQRWIVPESGLGAIAMMHVEIGNGDTAEAVVVAGVLRGDCNRIEQAKSHREVRLGMMAGRTDGGKGSLCATL